MNLLSDLDVDVFDVDILSIGYNNNAETILLTCRDF